MFRSTTVAVDPVNQTRPDLDQNWVDVHTGGSAALTDPQTPLIQSFLPLDPTLETRLLSDTQWAYDQTDANNTTTARSCIRETRLDYRDLTTATIPPGTTTHNIMSSDITDANTLTNTRHFNKIPRAHHHLNDPISPNNITATATSNGSIFNKTAVTSSGENTNTTPVVTNATGISIRGRASHGASDVQSVPSRARPVSFSLPKRSCVLLHQSAAVFIQAGRGLSGKPDGVATQERTKDLGPLRSSASADVDDSAADHLDTRNQCSVDSKAIVSSEGDTGGLSETGAQVSSCDGNVITVDNHKDNETGAQVRSEREVGPNLHSNNEISGQICDGVRTTEVQASVCRDSEDVDNQTELVPTQELKDLLCPSTNQPQESVSGDLNESKELVQTQPKEPDSSASDWTKESTSSPLNRPKEPFYRVLGRDGCRVLLWPSEMVSYTQTSPSISYSVNPLLYDFRANNRPKETGEDKKGGLEEGREKIKPSVIKQPDCQPRRHDMEGGGGGVKIDERKEEDEGGQAGNPVEVVAHCSVGDAALDRSGCRGENTFKLVPVSAECHLEPALGLQNSEVRRKRRRRRRRGGARRGMRKSGSRKTGEPSDRKESERRKGIISSPSVNQLFAGRGEKREDTEREERRVKGLLSNLAARRLVGGKEKGMRREEGRMRGDQTERVRAGRHDEKIGELLSNLPVNRCNRCNQLCAQVKREASRHQSQQSASGWGQGLRKLLCRGAACNSVISPVPGSVIYMPRCPAITPDLARNDRSTEEIQRNTQEEQRDEEQRHPRQAEMEAAQDDAGNVRNLGISGASFACRDAARKPEICLAPAPQREAAGDPAISLVPAPFSDAACRQRQTIPAGRGDLAVGPAPRCSAHQSDTEVRIGSAGADMTRPGDAMVMMSQSQETAKRKREPPEAEAAPRKRRKRGRRQVRRDVRVLKHRQEGACVGSTSDLGVCGTFHLTEEVNHRSNRTGPEDENCLRHNTDDGEEALRRNGADHLDNYCVDSTRSVANDGSHDTSISYTLGQSSDESNSNAKDDNRFSDSNDDATDSKRGNKDLSPNHINELHHTNTTHTLMDPHSNDSFTCSTDDTRADRCQCEFKRTTNAPGDHSRCNCEANRDYNRVNDKRGYSDGGDVTHKLHAGAGAGDTAISHAANRSSVANNGVGDDASDAALGAKQAREEREAEEGREVERLKVREKQGEWEREWVRRKEREQEEKDRERRKEVNFELLYPEKRARFPHPLPPPPCIPLHTPLLLPPSLSPSSSFSFHHTIIQHHLSLLPPPPHLPVPSYPQLLPSFSPHLCPLTLNPPPAPPPPPLPPSFYTSPLPLLEAPGPYPVATAFHPMSPSHHPPLYPPPHPAVLPLQVLF